MKIEPIGYTEPTEGDGIKTDDVRELTVYETMRSGSDQRAVGKQRLVRHGDFNRHFQKKSWRFITKKR